MRIGPNIVYGDGLSIRGCQRGFSLPEAVMALVVVVVLGAISLGAYSKVSGQMDRLREIAAGRNLSNAFHLYASDHGGEFIPGIDARVLISGVSFQGRTISGMSAERYPYRLAPYLDYALEGTILVNGNDRQIDKIGMWDYGVSLLPALGMNIDLVGGYIDSHGKARGISRAEAIFNRDQADVSILVFASAGVSGLAGSDSTLGYFKVTPPINPRDGNWNSLPWGGRSRPNSYGHVSPRHDGEAVCVFLDGSTRMLNIDALRDMRLWSRNAALLDDPGYMLSE